MLARSEFVEPLDVRPCLAELFRTCVYASAVHLRIEKVVVESHDPDHETESSEEAGSSRIPKRRAYRLFLSDGVLTVQSLLASRLLVMINVEDIVAGNIIVLKKFKIRRAKRVNGQGEVVFLGIADCDILCSPPPSQQQAQTRKRSAAEHRDEDRDEDMIANKKIKSTPSPIAEGSFEVQPVRKRRPEQLKSSQDSDSDEFETVAFDERELDTKRRALRALNANRSFTSQLSVLPENADDTTGSATNRKEASFPSTVHHPSAAQKPSQSQPRSEPSAAANISHPKYPFHDLPPKPTLTTTPSSSPPTSNHPQHHYHHHHHHQRQQPHPKPPAQPPHHTLSTLLTSPTLPSKSYPCTLFAIISWTSPTLLHPRPHSPFPPKRHLKIHDPSITSRYAGVTLAVYCNAAEFRPAVGTLALFRGW